MRTAVQVARDIQTLKSTLKGDQELLTKLLKPLQEELQAIAEFQARQGHLPLEEPKGSSPSPKK